MTSAFVSKDMLDMIYLIACIMHETGPDEAVVGQMNFDSLYKMAKGHTLTAITAMAIEKTKAYEALEPAKKKIWQDAKNKAVRKNMLLDDERRKLFDFMESEAIWHMPLKGVILQNLYPRYGMRQMSDNDILFDESYALKVRGYMVSQGYKAVGFGKSNHDEYEKPPVYNFELHRELYQSYVNDKFYDYYKNVKERLIRKTDRNYEYAFTDEDFYIYITTHTNKHYSNGGTGLRSLLDAYCYTSKKTALDWQYIQREMKKLEIWEFEEDLRRLATTLFSEPAYPDESKFTEKELSMLLYVQSSGTYGVVSNNVENRIKKIKAEGKGKNYKLTYIFNRINPDKKWWEANFPFCARHPWAKPFCNIFRFVRGITKRRKKFFAELKALLTK